MKKLIQYFLLIFTIPLCAGAGSVDLDQIIFYLNNVKTLSADFEQVNHDGSISNGVLYLKKPGKFRMTYASPDTTDIFVKNSLVTILDLRKGGAYQKLSIRKNPLRHLLFSKFESNTNDKIVDFNSNDLKTTILLSDPKNTDQGTLEIIFKNKPLIFESWLVTNSLNEKVMVNLKNILVGEEFSDSLFDPGIEFNKITDKP